MARPKVVADIAFGGIYGKMLEWPPKEGQDFPGVSFSLSRKKNKDEYENFNPNRPTDLMNIIQVCEELLRVKYSKNQGQGDDPAF